MTTQIHTTPNMRKIARNVIPLPYIPLLLLLMISILPTAAAAQSVDIVPHKEIKRYDTNLYHNITATVGHHAYRDDVPDEYGHYLVHTSAWNSINATPAGDRSSYLCTAYIKGSADRRWKQPPDYGNPSVINQNRAQTDNQGGAYTGDRYWIGGAYAGFKKHPVSHIQSWEERVFGHPGVYRSLTLSDSAQRLLSIFSLSQAENVGPYSVAEGFGEAQNNCAGQVGDVYLNTDYEVVGGG